ncbi:MAG: hypothetical protein ACE5HV_10760 [Acidobacteriota bacterium]
METIERDYSPRDVKFYYVYKALAHPELNGYVQPLTLEERLMHVAEAKRSLGTRVEWLADNMDNELKRALGDVPNAELVIDPDGKVVRRRAWSDPTALRADLEELVGSVDNPTTLADLDMAAPSFAKPTVATGVVPRVEMPGRMQALKIEPVLEGAELPFYAKLRLEADQGVMRDGTGKLYVGFHLDPLYHVHWNNLAPPLQFELQPPQGVSVSPARATFPKVEEEADADPREFLLEIDSDEAPAPGDPPLELKVDYYACDNDNTWCIPVSQSYLVHLERDPDGGRVFGRGAGGRIGGGRFGGQRAMPGRGPDAGRRFDGGDFIERVKRWDANGDGLIVREEVPERMRERFFDRADTDGDGVIDADELEAIAKRFRRGRGSRGIS